MKKPRVTFYRDAKREWRWRVVAANGRVVADGAESYERRKDAFDGAMLAGEILWHLLRGEELP